MASTEVPPRRVERSGPGFAYLMTGIALGCIVMSGVMSSIFSPEMVTGAQHEHIPTALFGWIFNAIAIGMVATTAMQGIRVKVTHQAPWAMLGLGVGGNWLVVMFVAIFAPVWVTGTDPTQIPIWAGLSAIFGVILTGIWCSLVKTASFEPTESKPGSATAAAVGPSAAEDAAGRMRQLAQLRKSGVITETEFQAMKKDLLSRI